MIAFWVITGLCALPLIIVSIFFIHGKGGSLLAGYNTMSAEKKARLDEKAMLRFMGYLIIVFTVLFLVGMAGSAFELGWLSIIGFTTSFIILIGGLIYANTGNRFHKPEEEISASVDSRPSKTPLIITVAITAVSVLFVSILMYQGYKEPDVIIGNNSFEIKSIYGLTVRYADVVDITLIESNMSSIMGSGGKRTNGFGGFSDANKGYFTSSRTGDILIFTRSKSAPTIKIEHTGNMPDIYISFNDSSETRILFEKLTSVVR